MTGRGCIELPPATSKIEEDTHTHVVLPLARIYGFKSVCVWPSQSFFSISQSHRFNKRLVGKGGPEIGHGGAPAKALLCTALFILAE